MEEEDVSGSLENYIPHHMQEGLEEREAMIKQEIREVFLQFMEPS